MDSDDESSTMDLEVGAPGARITVYVLYLRKKTMPPDTGIDAFRRVDPVFVSSDYYGVPCPYDKDYQLCSLVMNCCRFLSLTRWYIYRCHLQFMTTSGIDELFFHYDTEPLAWIYGIYYLPEALHKDDSFHGLDHPQGTPRNVLGDPFSVVLPVMNNNQCQTVAACARDDKELETLCEQLVNRWPYDFLVVFRPRHIKT